MILPSPSPFTRRFLLSSLTEVPALRQNQLESPIQDAARPIRLPALGNTLQLCAELRPQAALQLVIPPAPSPPAPRQIHQEPTHRGSHSHSMPPMPTLSALTPAFITSSYCSTSPLAPWTALPSHS